VEEVSVVLGINAHGGSESDGDVDRDNHCVTYADAFSCSTTYICSHVAWLEKRI
jgi:hypothetical protein